MLADYSPEIKIKTKASKRERERAENVRIFEKIVDVSLRDTRSVINLERYNVPNKISVPCRIIVNSILGLVSGLVNFLPFLRSIFLLKRNYKVRTIKNKV